MTRNETVRPRTAVYIDGYNLYYGRLRNTPFKWLDLVQLFQAVLTERDQNEQLMFVKLFTAPALAAFATHGAASVRAQSAYHRALKAKYSDRFHIIYGNHTYNKHGALMPIFLPEQPFDRENRVRVWRLEEKKTDVNLALGMYRDLGKGLCDRIILVTNDTDLEPALAAIREDFPVAMIGVVAPVRHTRAGTTMYRAASGSLSNLAHWAISYLSDDQLLQAQLPPIVPTKKKPILKPAHW